MPLLTPITPQQLPGSSNLLQSRFWAEFKSGFGWHPHAFLYREKPFLLLERRLPGGYALLYTPHPFESSGSETGSDWDVLCGELRKVFHGRKICIRFDLPWETGDVPAADTLEAMGLHGLRPAVMDIQPPNTVIVPLTGSPDEQLQAMKSKTRYNIRLAGRKGVETRQEAPEFIDQWYALYRETAARDRIAIHSPGYYRALFETAARIPEGGPDLRIVSARHEGDLLAAVIISLYGGRATYLYGASSNIKRNLMASYAAQWAAMSIARENGCVAYDLFGIPPADDPGHPMHGLYRFKTGFGGRIVRRAGAWDLPLSGVLYPLYRTAESARNYYYKKLKKR